MHKVIIGMATMKGRERNVIEARKSLLNNTVIPNSIITYDNSIMPIDLTDNGKFYGLSCINEPVYYFSCDDDLIYPPDYIEKTIQAIEKHGCIVTYHGRVLKGLKLNYYKGHRAYACLHTVPKDFELDVCGTGVTAFRTDYFNPVGIHEAKDQKMSDLVFSLEAAKHGKKIMHLAHNGGWIKYQDIPIEKTIYGMEHKKCDRQGQLADEIYRLKYVD